MFKKQTASPQSILDPIVKAQIEKSFNTAVKVPVVNFQDITIGNVRTCALQTDGLTTAMVTLTAITYTFGFLAYPMQYYENYLSYSTAISKLLDAHLQKLASTLDAAAVAFLETNKNQYFPASVLDYYAQVGGAFQVPQAAKNDFYNQAGSLVQTMDFNPMVDVVTNPIGMANVRRMAAQGSSNATNLEFQLLGYTWWPTNNVVNGAGVESTLYLVAPGAVAVVFRNSPDGKAKTRIHESKYWDLFVNAPYIGADLDVYYQADCADASALQGGTGMAKLTQTKIESWQFAVDVFWIKPYNSAPTTTFTPIVKVEIMDA